MTEIVPKVSVIVATYNRENVISDTIDSIFNQTFQDYEIIIVDDGSTDNTNAILKKYGNKINYVNIYHSGSPSYARNTGIKLAKGKYIAILDSDDLWFPEKLEKQVNFMENHSDVGVLGTFFETVNDDNGNKKIYLLPTNPNILKWCLIFSNCIAHSSVIIRSEIIKMLGYYDKSVDFCEDYDLWIRASRITNIANLPEVLLSYHIHDSSISSVYFEEQEKIALCIMILNVRKILNNNVSDEIILNMKRVYNGFLLNNNDEVENAFNIMFELYNHYTNNNNLNLKELNSISNIVMYLLLRQVIKERNMGINYRIKIFLKVGIFKMQSIKDIMLKLLYQSYKSSIN
ncbi:putative glycosyltransferase [Methanocella paludicola SANAE]|uniref:Glycosyltransferase n=1 Tax=Methanocella paludicola (strain DSM 17711 / JCM 13418 / NBRC 101707 / SANAE) TaxID=304371 RepID=D1YZY2_METPS|nr:glycosyltransferase [Methanocella paludicola]BAI62004.1 putative glycosyltransferase [Methanocella paludicola SANAE]